jgi:RNA polymerase sigma factor (sigma-70 family)
MQSTIYTKQTSDELWQLCIYGDHKAFKEIFDREFNDLLEYGLKVSPNKTDVKDAIQEVFTDLWDKKSTRKINNIKFYILKSLKYNLLKIKPLGKIIDINSISKEKYSHTIESYDNDTLAAKVSAILSQMPRDQQEILHLKYFQGLSNRELAEVLDINYQSVSNRLHRVINVIRKKIQKKSVLGEYIS